MKIAVYLLFLQSLFLLYYSAGAFGSERYMLLIFGLLNFLLAWGIVRGERRAIKITIAYKGVDFFFALLMLMAGNLFQSLNAAIDLAILHDLIGLFGKKEEPMEGS
ncbi:hypothetical protein NF865_01005 [Thermococcus aggregans]|uniref:Uncharacterized protein n=1 Tax=Thermococcus aggregans TaxID=110163 RepID=A0A9E7MXQ8_THEAG|nr:hypothetical protein [Thermococcus aggregans]MCD6189061.1 hypothetical protein [Thermococcus sp.]USS40833.1 hypothetical protein NF865_01005 [Thermococcus aggregans]